MPYLPVAIANSFLDIANAAGEPMDPMKIQKLTYFGHGWHLGYGLGALSAENAEAWRWGPVFPELYHAVKAWGSGPIMKPIRVFDAFDGGKLRWSAPRIPTEEALATNLIQRVWDVYGRMSGLALSRLTHEPDGPWSVTWSKSPGVRHLVIPNALIRRYFEQKIQENAGRA
jgi:uncharacterized phage-associated protein